MSILSHTRLYTNRKKWIKKITCLNIYKNVCGQHKQTRFARVSICRYTVWARVPVYLAQINIRARGDPATHNSTTKLWIQTATGNCNPTLCETCPHCGPASSTSAASGAWCKPAGPDTAILPTVTTNKLRTLKVRPEYCVLKYQRTPVAPVAIQRRRRSATHVCLNWYIN